MNVTATLFGQMITFAILIWFVGAFLWGPMIRMLEDRKKRIAEGLAAAERGKQEQQLAEERSVEVLREAKQEAAEIIAKAKSRSDEMVEEAKEAAAKEAERIKEVAQEEMAQQLNQAKEALRKQVGVIAIQAASQVLKKEINPEAHNDVIADLAAQI